MCLSHTPSGRRWHGSQWLLLLVTPPHEGVGMPRDAQERNAAPPLSLGAWEGLGEGWAWGGPVPETLPGEASQNRVKRKGNPITWSPGDP